MGSLQSSVETSPLRRVDEHRAGLRNDQGVPTFRQLREDEPFISSPFLTPPLTSPLWRCCNCSQGQPVLRSKVPHLSIKHHHPPSRAPASSSASLPTSPAPTPSAPPLLLRLCQHVGPGPSSLSLEELLCLLPVTSCSSPSRPRCSSVQTQAVTP